MKRILAGDISFSKGQYLFLASFAKTLSEGIILGASGAFFLPEAFQFETPISAQRFVLLALAGLFFLLIGVILQRRGEI